MVNFLLIFASLWYLVSPQCIQTKCVDDTEENKNKCQIEVYNPHHFEVRKCPSGSVCSKKEGSAVVCDKKYRNGDICTKKEECYSGVCEGSVCKGKGVGEKCTYHEECLDNLYCLETCKEYKKAEQEGCLNSLECPFGYGCGSDVENGPLKCLKLYSIKTGQYSTGSEFCESGFSFKNKMCAESVGENDLGDCLDNTDCIMKVRFGTQEEITTFGECVCTFLEAKKACAYSTAHKNFQTSLNKLKEYFRGNPTDKSIAVAKTSYNYDVRKVTVPLDVMYKGVDQCVLDYYIGKDPEPPTPSPPEPTPPEPTPTSSSFFKTSFNVFVFFAFILQ